MEFNSILKNEEVRNILEKAAIPTNRIEEIANQAILSIQGQLKLNPTDLKQLKSGELNEAISSDFIHGLVTNIGLSASEAHEMKDLIPPFISNYAKQLGSETKDQKLLFTTDVQPAGLIENRSKDSEKKIHPKKPFSHPPKDDPHQGHGRPDGNKLGVQFTGGNQGGGSFKKKNKGS